MSDEQVSGALRAAIDSAADYIDTYIAPDREEATQFYRGEPFGNEEDGRSQIVMSEVRDVVQAMMPSLMRVFMSTKQAVEFLPNRADAVEQAEQATDYINHIFYVENSGTMVLYDALKDALIRKTGFVKYYVEEKAVVTEEEYSGLSQGQYALLTEDKDLEIDKESVEAYIIHDPLTGVDDVFFELSAKRTVKKKVFKVVAVPPEEIIIARNARSIKTADFVSHRSSKLVSELVAEGYDIEDVLAHGSPEPTIELNQEAQARNPAIHTRQTADLHYSDPSMLRVPYYESWILMDQDGDGIAELRRICSIGPEGFILDNEVVTEIPLALFCPDPEPHTAIGYSIADQTKDLQKIKSNIVRGTLDSLAQSIHPRTAVVEGQANMDDVLNTEIGGVIRMRQIGAVQPLETPFVGGQALPVLAYLDDVRAQRTGISRATQGLDADVLQSTTQDAVRATVSAAESRLEMVARIFAEGGMRQLFCGLLRLVVQHQDKARVVRLRRKWVEVDPRGWDAEMDVTVNVGIGTGDKQERIAVLSATMAKQQEALTTLGPMNPLVDMSMLRNTMAKILELSGEKDVDSYWKEVTPESLQQYQQQMQQNQKPDPAEILAQIEKNKVDADIEMNRRKVDLDYMKAKMDDDRLRDQMEADILLRAAELEFKYHTAENDQQMQKTMAQINQSMARERTIIDTAVKVSTAEAQSQERADAAHAQEQQQLAAQQAAQQQPPAPGAPVQ
jgi:hypothetical protein